MVGFNGLDGAVQELLGRAETQQTLGGFLECREMGYGQEFTNLAEIRPVVQYFYNAPILGLEEHSQHQAHQQLRLCVLLGAVAVIVFRQRLSRDLVGDRRHFLGRLACRAHTRTIGTSRTRKADSPLNNEVSAAFLQSKSDRPS